MECAVVKRKHFDLRSWCKQSYRLVTKKPLHKLVYVEMFVQVIVKLLLLQCVFVRETVG